MASMNERELQVGVKAFIRRGDRFLLLRRAEPFDGETEPRWDIPGGRIKPGEPIRPALAREIREETGLVLTSVDTVLYAQDILRVPTRHVVRITFLASVADGEVILHTEEHSEVRWMTLGDLRAAHHDTYLEPVLDHPALTAPAIT